MLTSLFFKEVQDTRNPQYFTAFLVNHYKVQGV